MPYPAKCLTTNQETHIGRYLAIKQPDGAWLFNGVQSECSKKLGGDNPSLR